MRTSAVLTTLAVLIGAIASAFSTEHWQLRVAYAAVSLASLASIVFQVKESRPFIVKVSPTDWKDHSDGSLYIAISARQHGKGLSASGRLEQELPDGSHEVVIGDTQTTPKGDVLTIIGKQSRDFKGRIVVG